MLTEIINSFKGELTQNLTQKTGLTPDKASESVNLAKQEVVNGLNQEASSGNISGLLDLFKGGQDIMRNPIAGNIMNQYAGSLITKLGLPESVSRNVSAMVIPFILNQIQSRTANRPANEVADLMGNEFGGLTGMLSKGLFGQGK
jgi:hypothetical protein